MISYPNLYTFHLAAEAGIAEDESHRGAII